MTIKEVNLHRSDFARDSEGTSYFDYMLAQLGIPEENRSKVEEVTFPALTQSDHHAVFSGKVSQYGYIITNETLGEDVYRAGNCPHESTQVVELEHALSLQSLCLMCDSTGEEFAKEHTGYYTGHLVVDDLDE